MNKQTKPDKPSDIDALFKAQNVQAPAELDDFILAEARQAVDHSAGNVQRVVPGVRYRSWLTAAAAVLITVGIAPILLQTPESGLESSLLESDTASVSAEAFAKPMAMSDAEQDSIQTLDTAAPSKQLTTESLTTAASDELPTTSSRMLQRKSAPIGYSEPTQAPQAPQATTFETSRSTVYRQSPDTWIREMQRLESENQMAKAYIEYDQFRQRHPRFETDYRPKDLPRNSPTDLPTDLPADIPIDLPTD